MANKELNIVWLNNGNALLYKDGKRITLTPHEQDELLAELQVRYHERCVNEC